MIEIAVTINTVVIVFISCSSVRLNLMLGPLLMPARQRHARWGDFL
jgi:hypothetical protein